MLQLDVCIESVFTDLPIEERIARTADCGFDCIEFWLHDATFDGNDLDKSQSKDAASLRQACEAAGVTINNMVVNAPDDGAFGVAPVVPELHGKYLERLAEVIEFAKAAGCNKAITCAGDVQPSMTWEQMRANIERALGQAAAIAEKSDFILLLEPLNTHVDHPGYCLDSSGKGADIVRGINSPNLQLLFDVYHMQIMEGNIIAHIQDHADIIGHFHSAAVPGRGEHYEGELNYPAILKAILEAGYAGSFGLEYFPKLDDHALSLKKVREYLERA